MKMYAKQNGQTVCRDVVAAQVSAHKKRGWLTEAPKVEKPKGKSKQKASE